MGAQTGEGGTRRVGTRVQKVSDGGDARAAIYTRRVVRSLRGCEKVELTREVRAFRKVLSDPPLGGEDLIGNVMCAVRVAKSLA